MAVTSGSNRAESRTLRGEVAPPQEDMEGVGGSQLQDVHMESHRYAQLEVTTMWKTLTPGAKDLVLSPRRGLKSCRSIADV